MAKIILPIILFFPFLASAQRSLEIQYPIVRGLILPEDPSFPEYVVYIFNLSIVIAAFTAMIIFLIAGIRLLISVGRPEVIIEAKKQISSAFFGLLILISSFVILHTISPYFVQLTLPYLKPLDPVVIDFPSYEEEGKDYRSLITTELPFGVIIKENLFGIKEITIEDEENEESRTENVSRTEEIKDIAQRLYNTALPLVENNRRLWELSSQCSCQLWQEEACVYDPCANTRSQIQENINRNIRIMRDLTRIREELDHQLSLWYEEALKLEKAETMMIDCPQTNLASLARVLERRTYFEQEANEPVDIIYTKYWDDIIGHRSWSTFHCPSSGSTGFQNRPVIITPEKENLRWCQTEEIPVGEIISRAKGISHKIAERLTTLIRLTDDTIQSINRMHNLLSNCTNEQCYFHTPAFVGPYSYRGWTMITAPYGSRITNPCDIEKIELEYWNISFYIKGTQVDPNNYPYKEQIIDASTHITTYLASKLGYYRQLRPSYSSPYPLPFRSYPCKMPVPGIGYNWVLYQWYSACTPINNFEEWLEGAKQIAQEEDIERLFYEEKTTDRSYWPWDHRRDFEYFIMWEKEPSEYLRDFNDWKNEVEEKMLEIKKRIADGEFEKEDGINEDEVYNCISEKENRIGSLVNNLNNFKESFRENTWNEASATERLELFVGMHKVYMADTPWLSCEIRLISSSDTTTDTSQEGRWPLRWIIVKPLYDPFAVWIKTITSQAPPPQGIWNIIFDDKIPNLNEPGIGELSKLGKLNKLSGLNKLIGELSGLTGEDRNSLEQRWNDGFERLGILEKLEKLGHNEKLKDYGYLGELGNLILLEEIGELNLENLGLLIHLEDLSRLNELEELYPFVPKALATNLEKLGRLGDLAILIHLDEAERLKKIDEFIRVANEVYVYINNASYLKNIPVYFEVPKIGLNYIIDEIVPKLLSDLKEKVEEPMSSCVSISDQKLSLIPCTEARGLMDGRGEFIDKTCSFLSPELLFKARFSPADYSTTDTTKIYYYINSVCPATCYLESSDYNECLEKCRKEEFFRTSDSFYKKDEMTHRLNFYCCSP